MAKTQSKRNVLITGAGTGIGLSAVQKFLSKGWHVYAHYNQSAGELKTLKKDKKNSLDLIQSNFADKKDVVKFIEQIKKVSLNALVNNAGIHDFSHEAKDRIESIQEVLMVNTIVPTLLAEALMPTFRDNKGGAIVNISSIGVKYGSNLKSIFYSVSKSGLEATTKTLAREGAAYNILVNSIRVGVTDTDFHKKLGKDMNQRKQLIPLKRLARPEELAEFIYFLSAKNTFMTGETISVAGGE